jgi:hypothetical protein
LLISFLIIAISVLLFLYWFRYTCILILSTRTSRDYARQVAAANQLSFLEARRVLSDDTANAPLAEVRRSLERDYQLLTYLLNHGGAGFQASKSIETRILVIDNWVMCIWYGIVQKLSPGRARDALLEMSSIINHLANSMGEQMTARASA